MSPEQIKPTTVVIIKELPNVGECWVIRHKEFENGLKYELRDMYGRTWHKRADELKVLMDPLDDKKKAKRKIEGELF